MAGDGASGKESGTGYGAKDKATFRREPKGADFQTMRARARGGSLKGKQYPRDALLGGEKPRANVKPGKTDLMQRAVEKTRMRTEKTSNNPGLPVFKQDRRGYKPPTAF